MNKLLDLLEEGAMFDWDHDDDWNDWSCRALHELQKKGRLTGVICHCES